MVMGFDDITESEDYKEIRQDLKDYRENEPHVAHRIVKRRVLRTTITEHAMCSVCAEIAIQGYSDNLADVKEHQDRCNYIDKFVLPGRRLLERYRSGTADTKRW